MKNLDRVKTVLATVAPTVAAALGGPLAGVATQAIAAQLSGKDASAFDLESAVLGATGDDLVRLKQVEAEFKAKMEEAGIELERIAADDRKSARDRQSKSGDRTPTILGALIFAGFFGMLAALMLVDIPAGAKDVVVLMIGALGTLVTQVANYFFGSSVGSKTKDGVIADLKGLSANLSPFRNGALY